MTGHIQENTTHSRSTVACDLYNNSQSGFRQGETASYEEGAITRDIADSSLAIPENPGSRRTSTGTPPQLSPEVLILIFNIWAKDDVPVVSPVSGGIRYPGWWTSLRVPKFREIALSSRRLWARTVTAVPKAFGMAIGMARDSPLHFELSPSVPCLDWDGVSRLDLEESVDIWGEMIANEKVVAQVASLVLKESNAIHQFARYVFVMGPRSVSH